MSKDQNAQALDDAIRAQQALVNQLADVHTTNHDTYVRSGEAVRKAHEDLTALIARKYARAEKV